MKKNAVRTGEFGMLTEKLFYEDPHLKTFTATVLSCEKVTDYCWYRPALKPKKR